MFTQKRITWPLITAALALIILAAGAPAVVRGTSEAVGVRTASLTGPGGERIAPRAAIIPPGVGPAQVNPNEYMWVAAEEEKHKINYWINESRTYYKRLPAGKHADGTEMYVCRGMDMGKGSTPGKLYKNKCYVPWAGKEHVLSTPQSYYQLRYEVLLTRKSDYQWINISQLSAAVLKTKAVPGGKNGDEPLYVCRAQLSDGVHAGKYLPSSGLCYIAWGGKEVTVNKGFEVLKSM